MDKVKVLKLKEQDSVLSEGESNRSLDQKVDVDLDSKQEFFNPTMLLVLMMSVYPKDTHTNLYQAKIS